MFQNQEKNNLTDLEENIRIGEKQSFLSGLAGSERAYVVSRLLQKLNKHIVVITGSPKEAEKFIEDLNFFSRPSAPRPWYFQQYNILPYNKIAFHNDTAASRIRVLYELSQALTPNITVTTIGAVLQKLIPRNLLLDFAELLVAGEEVDRDGLIYKITSGGYCRTNIVEEPGDFSVRGGILDLFSPLYDDPVRIEFFGDMVESIRFFSPTSQLKTKAADEAVILPAREVILKKEDLSGIVGKIRQHGLDFSIPPSKTREVVERIKTEGIFPGLESLLPLLYPSLDTFFDWSPEGTLFVVLEPGAVEKASAEMSNRLSVQYGIALEEGRLAVDPEGLYLSHNSFQTLTDNRQVVDIEALKVRRSGVSEKSFFHQQVEDNAGLKAELSSPGQRENLLQPLADWVNKNKDAGLVTIITCSSDSRVERLQSLLGPYGIKPVLIPKFPEIRPGIGLVYMRTGQVSDGFVWNDQSLALVTDTEILGNRRRRRKKGREKARAELLRLEDLKTGDLVVHADHGIGRYEGLKKLNINGVENDFILIIYKDEDRLYLPVDRMNAAKKYVGVEGIIPILDKMGGKSWLKVKARAKKEVEKIAGELLHLYASRKVKSGHAFGKADSYFRDFEAGFDYEETPDQLKAIEDVLDDMESQASMDRLVCGDVGYGKTEVALRAAFKGVSDSKQVAVLVPTTVLAEQHFKTFSLRFAKYPVNIACLNRFRSKKDQEEILAGLKQGRIDIVIGTHRLIQKDVEFKDLGLIILDEEQRFGVKHKERLKKIRAMVDVLALTATPIPRTLHMSLMGVRDISVISTPPEERRAIVTYISEFDKGLISEAIRKELKRNGQVFFIHNNIRSIDRMAKLVRDLVPEARLGVAHGRLTEDELEKVMMRFINRDMDVLVTTTIVESGLDIPDANTIIINRADRFGLSQIYQLRGRVGRAEEQAYAYLFIPSETALSKNAQKRIKVLMEHSDLGAGFQIAMSDLQIRGGGDLLGISQSGRIAAVGYDMFLELMEKATAQLKGEPVSEPLEPEINVAMSALIPESYIEDIDQRLSAYRRLARMEDLNEIAKLKEELIDRYGPVPDEAGNMLLKIMLKIMSKRAGVKRLDLTEKTLSLHFSEIHQKRPFALVEIVTSSPGKYVFTPDHVFKARLKAFSIKHALVETKNILKEIALHVNA